MRISVRYHRVDRLFYLCKGPGKTLLRDLFSVDLKALCDMNQMRGSKQPRPVSGMRQDRREKCADRTFSICPCHVDHLHPTLRVPDPLKQLPRVLRFVLLCKLWYFLYVCNRFCIIHPGFLFLCKCLSYGVNIPHSPYYSRKFFRVNLQNSLIFAQIRFFSGH